MGKLDHLDITHAVDWVLKTKSIYRPVYLVTNCRLKRGNCRLALLSGRREAWSMTREPIPHTAARVTDIYTSMVWVMIRSTYVYRFGLKKINKKQAGKLKK